MKKSNLVASLLALSVMAYANANPTATPINFYNNTDIPVKVR